MAKNIEIKARIGNEVQLMSVLNSIVKQKPEILVQKDIFYKIRNARLKLRSINGGENELIFYRRPDDKSPKESSYYRIKVIFPSIANLVLRTILGTRGIVKKHRNVFYLENIRIHLDRVEGIGSFIEFEYLVDKFHTEVMGRERLKNLLSTFEINSTDLCAISYIDFLEREHDVKTMPETSF